MPYNVCVICGDRYWVSSREEAVPKFVCGRCSNRHGKEF